MRSRLNKRPATLLALTAVALGMTRDVWAAPLVVDNFEGPTPTRNALGHDTGAWNRYPDDESQGCRAGRDETQRFGETGAALRIDYDVESSNPAFCGIWTALGGMDLRPYRQLVLYLKGDAVNGFTSQLKLELKPVLPPADPEASVPAPAGETEEVRPRLLLTGITGQWQRFAIPLETFPGLTDRSRIKELVIILDDLTATKKTGTVYLDEVRFED